MTVRGKDGLGYYPNRGPRSRCGPGDHLDSEATKEATKTIAELLGLVLLGLVSWFWLNNKTRGE